MPRVSLENDASSLRNKYSKVRRESSAGFTNRLSYNPVNTKHSYNIYKTPTNVGPTLYKCYTNDLCLLEKLYVSQFEAH